MNIGMTKPRKKQYIYIASSLNLINGCRKTKLDESVQYSGIFLRFFVFCFPSPSPFAFLVWVGLRWGLFPENVRLQSSHVEVDLQTVLISRPLAMLERNAVDRVSWLVHLLDCGCVLNGHSFGTPFFTFERRTRQGQLSARLGGSYCGSPREGS